MPRTCLHRRHLPRAGIDRIDRPGRALAMIGVAVHRPLRDETIALLLDDRRRGHSVVAVTGTHDPDAVVEVAERIADAERIGGPPGVGAVVLATVRPDGAVPCPGPDGRSDVDRWLETSDLLDRAGIDLLEWFVVVAEGVAVCPRELFGEPPRW